MKSKLISNITKFAAIAAGLAVIWGAMPVNAETYPDRPISLIVSYGAGGATDFQARIVTMVSGNEDLLTQPIVIINKPGAGGRVGWNWFATKADKDGYQLSAYNVPHFIAQSIDGKVKYNVSSFEPIANWGADPAVIIVGKNSKFNSLKDLVDFAKKNAKKLTVSGAGLLVGHHIAALQLEKAAGIKVSYIPTQGGGAAALKAVIAGDVLSGINNLSDAYRAREAGNVKILAVADLERNDFIPDVPTFREQGVDVDNSSVNFRGIMAPAGTPKEVIDFLAERVPKMFNHKSVKSKLKDGGSPIKVMTRAEVQAMWKERQAYLAELLKDL